MLAQDVLSGLPINSVSEAVCNLSKRLV
jgi:hypothetical protein